MSERPKGASCGLPAAQEEQEEDLKLPLTLPSGRVRGLGGWEGHETLQG